MNIVLQPRALLVRGRNAEMGTAAGADELVEVPDGPFTHRDLLSGGLIPRP